ncbi:MAG: hypothetical protein OXK21_03960 [Chloroflexota bacterium]|nr:hypothetical protein [Chloroflexota bacterium]
MWPFGGKSSGKSVTREMRIELATQCGLPYPESEALLAVTQPGKLAGRKITNFRVFAATGDRSDDGRGFNDLIGDNVLYDGIIERDGVITMNKGRKMR